MNQIRVDIMNKNLNDVNRDQQVYELQLQTWIHMKSENIEKAKAALQEWAEAVKGL